jgi:5-methylcytosine-specific restriction endonuclease McrA
MAKKPTPYRALPPRKKDTSTLASKIHASARWTALSIHKRRIDPCCERCVTEYDRATPATSVHHIQPLSSHPHLAYSVDNLMSLCSSCHATIERSTSK